MKVFKQIVTKKELDIKFTGITLLSKDEYNNNKDIIPPVNSRWWLRSPGYLQYFAVYVYADGPITDRTVDSDCSCVRPALYIWKSSDLNRGDKFELAGRLWTVLSNNLALCDDTVGQTCFREDRTAEDANDYEKSDIKKWLHDWAEENDISFMMQAFSPD